MYIKVNDENLIDMDLKVSTEAWSDYFVAKLSEKFQSRKVKNPKYSLRQWAKTLHLSIGAVSEILSKSRKITKTRALEIMPLAQFTDYEISYACALMGHSPKFAKELASRVGQDGLLVLRYIEMQGGCAHHEGLEEAIVKSGNLSESELRAALASLEGQNLIVKVEDQSYSIGPSKLPVFYEVTGDPSSKSGLTLDCSFVGSAEEMQYIRHSIAKLLREIEVFRHAQAKDTVYRLSLQFEECGKRD
ncbi:MAG: hypothetical protein K2Q26_06170 [Bdellovibrionales bacterium]|nr:hypothetical protein [Bdellovibrionales bacterium]